MEVTHPIEGRNDHQKEGWPGKLPESLGERIVGRAKVCFSIWFAGRRASLGVQVSDGQNVLQRWAAGRSECEKGRFASEQDGRNAGKVVSE